MGLFFNYNKVGPGVEKDEPRRKGVALYFELLWRSIGKLCLANILYFAISLPIFAVYFLLATHFLGIVMPEEIGTIAFVQSAFLISLVVVILWGTGPVSAGFTYILRNTAREEHFFTCSDFFEKSKESFKRGLGFLAIDVFMFMCSVTSIITYYNMAEKSGGIYTVLFVVSCLSLFIYTIMHFYLYEIEITFRNSFVQVYKNSIIMALATLPMCVLLTAIVYFATIILLGFLNPLIVLFVSALVWISIMRFAIDFYVARTIKKKILPKYENDDAEE